jgi:hypothetical protein
MRIRYKVPFQRDLIVADHWPIPLMGGVCRIIEEQGRAKALEITFNNQPVEYAPHVEELTEGPAKMQITGRDHLWISVKRHLDEAMAYLECCHNINLATDEIEAVYEAEDPHEEEKIPIKALSIGKHTRPFPLSFDMITRAMMAAEKTDGPKFVATLASTARKALAEQQYINSFRYSFLLIESLYGEGQFKSAGLKAALKRNAEFKAIVESELADVIKPKRMYKSDTAALLTGAPSADEMIDHLVDKRGFYFHGNVKRKDTWKPDDQREAQALALVAIAIVQLIAQKSAGPIFAPEFAERHFQDAIKAGAEIMFDVKFTFQEPGEHFQREGATNIRTPGTKVTGKQANTIAREFLRQFEHDAPAATLLSAECRVQGSNEKVFDLTFHVNAD